MKIKKDDLDKMTANSVSMATMGIALLLATRCPLVELYEIAEQHANDMDELRGDLGLEPLVPAVIKSGKISSHVKKAVALATEKKKVSKGKIGFQAPNGEGETKADADGNVSVEEDEIEVEADGGGFDNLPDFAKDLNLNDVDGLGKLGFFKKVPKVDKSKMN